MCKFFRYTTKGSIGSTPALPDKSRTQLPNNEEKLVSKRREKRPSPPWTPQKPAVNHSRQTSNE